MRPPSPLCDWCRKVAVPGKTGVGAETFKAPDDVIVKAEDDGSRTRLVVRAEPRSGKSERIVFVVHAALAVLIMSGAIFRPTLILPIVAVSAVMLASGMWLSRIVGARSEFTIDGSSFAARGWRGGVLETASRDVREVRVEAKGPSVEQGRARTAFDVVVTLDDGRSHNVATQFRRHEYAEETVNRIKAAVARATARG